MAILCTCPRCKRTFRLPNSAGGKPYKCPGCKGIVFVPVAPPDAEPDPEPEVSATTIASPQTSQPETLSPSASPLQEPADTQADDAPLRLVPIDKPAYASHSAVQSLQCPACGFSFLAQADQAAAIASCPSCHQVVSFNVVAVPPAAAAVVSGAESRRHTEPASEGQRSPYRSPLVLARIGLLLVVLVGCAVAVWIVRRRVNEINLRIDEANQLVDRNGQDSVVTDESDASRATQDGTQDTSSQRAATPLADELLSASKSPENLKTLMDRTPAPQLQAALVVVASYLSSPTALPEQKVLAEHLLKTLLQQPQPPATQKIAMAALFEAARRNPMDDRVVRQISEALFLSSSTPIRRSYAKPYGPQPYRPATESGPTEVSLEDYLVKCERAWADSCSRYPIDPLHDPHRLAFALMSNGNFSLYMSNADDARIGAVVGYLVKLAADPEQPGADNARQILVSLPRGSYGLDTTAQKRFKMLSLTALCRLLRETQHESVAREACKTLFSVLDLYNKEASLGEAPLVTAAQRAAVADRFEIIIAEGKPTIEEGVRAEDIRRRYSSSGYSKELLTDIGLTLFASCDRAYQWTGRSKSSSYELRGLLTSSNATNEMIRSINLPSDRPTMPSPTRPPDTGSDAVRIEQLGEELDSSDVGVRYPAIDRLAELDTPEAAAALLKTFKQKVVTSDQRTASRILHGLSKMHQTSIPGELIPLIRSARNPIIAHQITTALAQSSGVYVSSISGKAARLPPKSSLSERDECMKWWQSQRNLRWNSTLSYSRPVRSSTSSDQAAAWSPDSEQLKLVAAISHFVDLNGRILTDYRYAPLAAGSVGSFRLDSSPSFRLTEQPGADWGDRGDRVIEQLERLVRDHPRGGQHATRLKQIQQNHVARNLACDTQLQKVAVDLDTAGDLLDLLVREADPNDQDTQRALSMISTERQKAAASTTNVLHEIRESAFANLLLWDLLLKLKRQDQP